MTTPKRGMVAGKAIQTGDLTEAYDEGFDRTFGERKSERGRFIYRDGQCVRVDADWTDAERRAQTPTEELVYGNADATDGTPINTRRRHREYLKATGLTHASDYSEGFRGKVRQERELKADKSRREHVERAVFKHLKY